MSSLSEYMDNPHWAAMYNRAVSDPANGGQTYKRWVMGSPGMMHPMFIYSNEYSYTAMKHGQNDYNPYQGGLMNFSPGVTPNLQRQVDQCTTQTANPAGCQLGAVQQVFSRDASIPGNTPHPFAASYQTGAHHNSWVIPPNSNIQD